MRENIKKRFENIACYHFEEIVPKVSLKDINRIIDDEISETYTNILKRLEVLSNEEGTMRLETFKEVIYQELLK